MKWKNTIFLGKIEKVKLLLITMTPIIILLKKTLKKKLPPNYKITT